MKRSVIPAQTARPRARDIPDARLFYYYCIADQIFFLRLRLTFATTSRTGTFIPVVIVASSIS